MLTYIQTERKKKKREFMIIIILMLLCFPFVFIGGVIKTVR